MTGSIGRVDMLTDADLLEIIRERDPYMSNAESERCDVAMAEARARGLIGRVDMTKQRRRRTPWDRIIRAADAGTGLRLTAEDVRQLSRDGAIALRGERDALCFAAGHDPAVCLGECDEAC